MIPILTIEALYKNIHLSYIDIYTAPCIKKWWNDTQHYNNNWKIVLVIKIWFWGISRIAQCLSWISLLQSIYAKSIIMRYLRYFCRMIDSLFERLSHLLFVQFSDHAINCVTFLIFILLHEHMPYRGLDNSCIFWVSSHWIMIILIYQRAVSIFTINAIHEI